MRYLIWGRLVKIFISFFLILNVFNFILVKATDINISYKKSIVKEKIDKLVNREINVQFNNQYKEETNFFIFKLEKVKEKCLKNKLIGKLQDNNFIYEKCEKDTKYIMNFNFRKKIFLLTNELYFLIASLIITIIIYISNSYFFKIVDDEKINKKLEKIKMLNSDIYEKIVEYFDEKNGGYDICITFFKDNKFIYNMTLISKVLDFLELYHLKKLRKGLQPLEYFKLREFYYKLLEILKSKHYYTLYIKMFNIIKLFEMEYALQNKEIFKFLGYFYTFLTTRNYTSELQLLFFIIIFTFIHSLFLGIIINSNNILFNMYQTFSILSNLGGDISFNNSIGYIYGIYLQIVGVIYFGMLVSIIGRRINL